MILAPCSVRFLAAAVFLIVVSGACSAEFSGRHYRGKGDTEYLRLLETSRRMFQPDPELPNLAMLYHPWWNGFVEGPTWDAWWIQNSYGTTYSILPFLREPYLTFLRNSHELWFSQMGDGRRVGLHGWIAPDGCLCDCARPGWVVYKQGDGRLDIHDWAVEFTAAGVVMQAEMLLIGREPVDIARDLPRLERSVAFLESRRDPGNNLFLAGPAANLLAPSYAGWTRPDGTYGQAYLAGLSVTYIAALDRMIELEKLARRPEQAEGYRAARERARQGLSRLVTNEGYFIRSLDPDGTKHGVFGAPRHGYLETSPNHDAIAFRVVDDVQAGKIYQKIASIPGLRPHSVIIPNYPGYDDMYTAPEGMWRYGYWVNGGHWSTCEARMILAYSRLGKHGDARRSVEHLLGFARRFRYDNPLTDFGNGLNQPNQPVNIVYDSFGPMAALMRGLFEYLYGADSLTLVPHPIQGVDEVVQLDPVRFGHKKLRLAMRGHGPITAVRVNGTPYTSHDGTSVTLDWSSLPDEANVWILLGGSKPDPAVDDQAWASQASHGGNEAISTAPLSSPAGRLYGDVLRRYLQALEEKGLTNGYVASHARLALECLRVAEGRVERLRNGTLQPPPAPAAGEAEILYTESAVRVFDGLDRLLSDSERSATGSLEARLWRDSRTTPGRTLVCTASERLASTGLRLTPLSSATTVLESDGSLPAEEELSAEFHITSPSGGLHELVVEYASAESRPLGIWLNGSKILSHAAIDQTGGDGEGFLVERRLGAVDLKPGSNVLRLARKGSFPRVRQLRFIGFPETGTAQPSHR